MPPTADSRQRPDERVVAPLGRRACEVTENRQAGGYRIFSSLDTAGPEPRAGQFYMLASVDSWGIRSGRPYLPRAFSVAEAEVTARGVRLAILRRQLADRGVPIRTLLGFRDREHSGGVDELFGCCEVRMASEDGHVGHRGYVTELLAVLLEGDAARSAAVYACGPPAMLETVRALCLEREVEAELAMETPMACGFGACMGCAVPLADGGYMRLCTDGPVVNVAEIETALVRGSGH
jgi:dihydroorotate dehydrogenase electron transfer subunit